MTDRYYGLTVALADDIRSDDAEALVSAIRQLRGVADVTPHVVSPSEWIAQARARRELGEKLIAVLTDGSK